MRHFSIFSKFIYLACNDRNAFFTSEKHKRYTLWSCQKECEALIFLLDNIYIRFGIKLIVGIPMGTNCAPLVADLFVFCYERDFMMSLSANKDTKIIEAQDYNASLNLRSTLRPKNICVSANPTDPVFVFCFCADLAIFMAFQKKKKIFIPTDPNIFQKIGQTTLKMSELHAKIMLKIIFFNFLYVLYFIICMFSCTVDKIQPQ